MNPICAISVPHPPLIIPQVGRGQEREISNTTKGFAEAARFLASFEPETVVVISPHSVVYADYFHISPGKGAKGSFSRFGAGEVRFDVAYDAGFAAGLCRAAEKAGLPAGTLGERDKELDHGTMVPLYFIREAYGGVLSVPIVRIGLSGLPYADHFRLGMLITETAEALGRKIAVVASGDLSHRLKEDGPYGFNAAGPAYDERVMGALGSGAFGELLEFSESFCDEAGECGHRSFTIMAGCFDGVGVRAERLSYEGPFGVGYGVCTFAPTEPDESRRFLDRYRQKMHSELDARRKNEDAYVRLARQTVERYVTYKEIIPVPDCLPGEMLKKRAGTFVSLHKDGQLRGCIGTISATAESVAREIIQNAVSACSRDPRFDPVRPEELDDLEYSVDVLGDAEKISSPDELDVKRYGVIVTSGGKRGLLLPDLDGVDTVEKQIEIAKRKAGIRSGEKVSLQRFEVVRHF